MLTYRLNGPVLTDYELELCDLDSSIVKNYITANDVHNILSHANGEDITFNVNSAGGSVFEASEIYTMLSTYKGKVVVNITGLAASAASYMILGANEINISKSAQIMIHKPTSAVEGDSVEMKRRINLLDATEESIANLYHDKTGIPKEEIVKMMFDETWLTADKAKELGFVDNIINDNSIVDVKNIVASYNREMDSLHKLKNLITQGEDMNIFDKITSYLNGTEEVKNEVEEVVEETVEEPVVEEEQTETVEETEEKIDSEAILKEAVDKIKELTEQNEKLAKENAVLKEKDETINALTEKNQRLENKIKKGQNILNELNELVKSNKIQVIDNTSEKKIVEHYGRFGIEKREVEE